MYDYFTIYTYEENHKHISLKSERMINTDNRPIPSSSSSYSSSSSSERIASTSSSGEAGFTMSAT